MIDFMAIFKIVWGIITFFLLGFIKIFYTEFTKMRNQVDTLEKELIRIKTEAITRKEIDELLDRKVKPITQSMNEVKDSFTDFRKDMKSDTSDLRSDIQKILINMGNNKQK